MTVVLRVLILLSIVLTNVELSKVKLNCFQIRLIVDGHNKKRAWLAKGHLDGQPPAINMTRIAWHVGLAKKAEKWADHLAQEDTAFAHNPDRDIPLMKFQTGENLFRLSTNDDDFNFSVLHALDSWFEEHDQYKFRAITAKDYTDRLPNYGHYTQMIWADTLYIGCGMSISHRNNRHDMFVVCNYGPPGNVLGQTPYKRMRKGDNVTDLVCKTYECKFLPYGGKCKPKKNTWPTTKKWRTTTKETTTTTKTVTETMEMINITSF